MVNVKPPKVLQVNILSTVEQEYWFDGSVSDPWWGAPYRWRVTLSVTPSSHSDPSTSIPMSYTGDDIKVGDWVASGPSGAAVQIISIEHQSIDSATVVVEDIERYNTFNDPYQSGSGAIETGTGYVFELNDKGEPILQGISEGSMPSTYQSDIVSRFSYRNINSTYIRVNQPGHSFSIGDIIRVTTLGTFEKAVADFNVNAAIGVINSVGVPGSNWFTFKPFGKVMKNVKPDLVGSYGDVFFIDPENPGKLTRTRPEENIRPIYLRLESPNKAILLDAGMFDVPINGPVEESKTHKYEVDSVSDDQTIFTMPSNTNEVLFMSINGIENENFTFDPESKILIFDPEATGYGVDSTDRVVFIYKS